MDKNTNKMLNTKGGIKLLLSDEKDKEAISVKSPKELTIILADEKEIISLTDKNGDNVLTIDSKNGAITLTAKQKIVLKAGNCELTLDGQGGSFGIKGDKVEISGNQTVDIKANQTTTVKANQNVEVNGGAQTVVKGGIIQIN
ncbi:MAG: hypothetical protein RR315_06655, partial [Oscillospiraceae bacterium]